MDDPDYKELSYTNSDPIEQMPVYFVIDAYSNSGAGDFILTWSITHVSTNSGGAWKKGCVGAYEVPYAVGSGGCRTEDDNYPPSVSINGVSTVDTC